MTHVDLDHGTPDYGITNAAATVFRVTDLGELAVRLGSPISFHRTGDVIWWDDFECSANKWVNDLDGAGSSAAISNEAARNGLYSLKLVSGPLAGNHAAVLHRQALPSLLPLGVELSLHLVSSTDNMEVRFDVYTGTQRLRFAVRWRDTVDDLQYMDAAGAWVTFATDVNPSMVTTLFQTIKLITDPGAPAYVLFLLTNRAWSLSSIAPKVDLAGGPPYCELRVAQNGRVGLSDVVYMDDVILTQNEPH